MKYTFYIVLERNGKMASYYDGRIPAYHTKGQAEYQASKIDKKATVKLITITI